MMIPGCTHVPPSQWCDQDERHPTRWTTPAKAHSLSRAIVYHRVLEVMPLGWCAHALRCSGGEGSS